MALFFTMLPFYLTGNLHCLGMCGPLVMMIGAHRYRHAYFLGRLLSFSLAGMAAGEAGAILQGPLQQYHLPEALSLSLGLLMFAVAFSYWTGCTPSLRTPRLFRQINHSLSLLMLKDTAAATFLFGFLTVALPCGQSLIVFSACALAGDAWIGFFNSFAFALLTTPSLWVAMHAMKWFKGAKARSNSWIAWAALFAGVMAFCRGLADMGVISHLSFAFYGPYHVVLF